MAKGRMLQKRISNSRKMAMLSSDTARLLYTWILPHLDINGCFYADPVMVNNIVFTRLQKPVEVINRALDELEAVGLLVRYQVDGETYLHYPDFSEKQPSLQPTKEGKVTIPPFTPDKLQSNCGVTTEELHHKVKEKKLKEEKLKEGNAREDKPAPPVDNYSAPPLEEKTEGQGDDDVGFEEFNPGSNNGNGDSKKGFMDSLKEELGKLFKIYTSQADQRQIVFFVESNIRTQHPDAIIHVLQSLLKAKDKIGPLKAYLEAALKVENGNYHARDHDRKAQGYKRPVTKGEMNTLGDIFAAAVKGKT